MFARLLHHLTGLLLRTKPRVDVLIARSTAVAPDTRVERAARCLRAGGLKVLVLGWDRERRAPRKEVREDGTVIWRVRARGRFGGGLANLWGLMVFNLILLMAAFLVRPRVFHAVDMDTALAALVAKWVLGTRFFYDIADWYWLTRPRDPRFRKLESILRLLRRMEEWVMRHADYVCVPDEARLALSTHTPSKYVVVHNAPEDVETGAKEGGRVGRYFVYLGSLYEDRGLETIIQASVRAAVPLILGGVGPLEEMCKGAAERCENVTFIGVVTNQDALKIEAESVAVLALYDPAWTINRFAAPTKLYEAMMLGKPVIVAAETLPAKLVEQENIGMVVTYGDEEGLARAMRYLWEHREDAERMGANARRLYEDRYGWRAQCTALQLAYEALL